MRYYVHISGASYGPADLGVLAHWAKEGRISPDTVLQPEGSTQRLFASSIAGLVFPSFQSPPRPGNIAPIPVPGSASMSPGPPPPKVVSNYRRPDYEPPLFLEDEIKGKKELLYSFIFCVAGPATSFFHHYGIVMTLGGIYCGVVAAQKGRKLGYLAAGLNALAFFVAIGVTFIGWGF